MLKIHQPYIKRNKFKHKYCAKFALASIGVLLLAFGLVLGFSPATHPASVVYAASDSRTLADMNGKNMQDMNNQICANSKPGDTATMIDNRGDKISYKVIKMNDGTCWMAENLRLTSTTIDNTDSDMVSGSFPIPASSLINFGSSGMNANDGYAPHAYYNNDTTYGAYYNWYTATAGAGTSSVSSGDVSTSICPKGWKLPAYDSTGSFYNIISGTNGYKSSWTSSNSKNGYFLGNSTAFWPAAGFVRDGSLYNTGSNGFYWSRRAYSSSYSYNLYFYNSDVNPQDYNNRYVGFSVRCIADKTVQPSAPIFTDEADNSINVNVPSTLTIDTTSGMAENVDSSKITEGTATATISSNISYTVTIHSTQPVLKDSTVTTAEISPVSEINPVEPGNNSWGFWSNKTNADGSKIYDTPITTEPQGFYNTTTSSVTDKGNTTTHTYYVGISIAPSLPSGTYSTDVTITAATK